MDNAWHAKTAEEIIKNLNSSEDGLRPEEAELRFKKFGPNALPEAKVESILSIFIHQFKSPLIYILLGASAIVFLMGEIIDGSIILAVLLFNSIIGAVQEGRAQNTLLALKKFVETNATVLRGGREFIVPDTELVVGDIILVQEGEKIPADARIIVSSGLKADESSLTGESEPVHKISKIIRSAPQTGDQKNLVFKGTNIVSGSGKAVIFATGTNTVIGKIAGEIESIDTEIPLKANIRYLSRLIIAAVFAISVVIFAVGILEGRPIKDMFGTIVSLSVSVVPEGLPVAVTLILAMGVWRMGKRNALVKKLQAVEALGQARIIAVDKTGTITKNELVVKEVYVDGNIFDIEGDGYEPKGRVKLLGEIVDAANHSDLLFAGKVGALCSNARVMYSEEDKRWKISGDPTEAAMLVCAEKLGFHKDRLEKESPLIAEIPFDYRLKYHAVLHGVDDKNILTVVGAPEVILSLSEDVWSKDKKKNLDVEERIKIEEAVSSMSEKGLRVIAFAVKSNAGKQLKAEKIGGLSFVGLFGMRDTIRPEAKLAVVRAISAGMKVVMITGDHKVTAKAIARDVGIYKEGDDILTGDEIDLLPKNELMARLAHVSVFARVSPDHKLKIIGHYRERGEVVAMTGDGVNDAPSLVAADLGIAMGRIGTEVAKEASDIVLLDDNFGSIISAVEEGRNIYKTIKKVILYLFSTSLGEIGVISASLALQYPLPILPTQIIWLNFVTDGFLTVALAMETKEDNLLEEKYERPKKYIVDGLMGKRMALMSLIMTVGSFMVFIYYLKTDAGKALTMSLTTLAAFQWFNAWNCRSDKKSVFLSNPFSNKPLISATLVVIILQIAAIYSPIMQKILRTTPLDGVDWVIAIAVASSIIFAEEARKVISGALENRAGV